MAKKLKSGKYACTYCGEEFSNPVEADSHKDKHDLIYIALSRSDLNRLLQFIHLGNHELLTPTLLKSLNKYLRGNSA